jgi:predicted aspartyl protease
MGHVYAKALFRGNKGIHEEPGMLIDTGATYTFLPLSLNPATGKLEPTREPGALLV